MAVGWSPAGAKGWKSWKGESGNETNSPWAGDSCCRLASAMAVMRDFP
jgi:hypothetical protein